LSKPTRPDRDKLWNLVQKQFNGHVTWNKKNTKLRVPTDPAHREGVLISSGVAVVTVLVGSRVRGA